MSSATPLKADSPFAALASSQGTRFLGAAAGGGDPGGGDPETYELPELTNLRVHYDAYQETFENDDPVAQWTDRSGNDFHALQATADAKPLFKTAIINDLPVLQGDGSNDFMALGATTSLDFGASPFFIACVVRRLVDVNFAYVAAKLDLDMGFGWYLGYGTGAGAAKMQFGLHDTGGTLHEIVDSANVAVNVPTIYRAGWDGSEIKLWRNGALVDSLDDITTVDPASDVAASLFAWRFDGSTTTPFNGQIGEFIAAETAPTTDNGAAVDQYLSDKWGVALT